MIPYIIRTFRGGISDESDKGVPGSFKHGHNLDIHSRDDVLKCGSSVVTANESLFNDLVQFFVPATDGSTYAFGSRGSIYSRSGNIDDGEWNFAYNDENGNIKGAAEFQLSDGITYMYWATASSIARRAMNTGGKDLPWTNAVQDYKVEAISSSAVWHTMKLAAGQLNIANADSLATITYADAFSPAGLNIRPGNLINTVEEKDDRVILGSTRGDQNEEGHLWSWLTTESNYGQKKRIPIKGVNSIIDTEFMILQGGDEGELFVAGFGDTPQIAKISGRGKTNPGGVSILDDLAVFGIYDSIYPGIWSYGRRGKNRSFALNYEYRLAKTVAGSSISTIGAIAVIDGNLLASWGTTDGSTSDYGVDQVSSTTKVSQAIYEGLEFDAGNPHLSKTVDSIALTMSPLPSGTSVSAKFKQNKESDWRYAVMAGESTTFSTTGGTIAIFSIGKPARIYEVGVELNASGMDSPEIQSVISYLSKESFEFA